MKLAYRRKCAANMHAENEENESVFALAASVMFE